MAEREAKFRLKSYVINNASIKFDKDNIPSNFSVEMKRGGYKQDNGEYHSSIVVGINDAACGFELNVTCKGIFEFNRELTADEQNQYFSVNAPAILFPYVRAYITTLTALSGINPIILPTINLSARKE